MPKEVNKKQDNKKQNKDKKHFMKDFKAELKRVIWPTPKQLFNNTVAVITVVLITAVIVFVLDLAFESINTYGIDKIKQIVDTNQLNSTNTSADNSVNKENINDVANNTSEEQTSENAETSNTEKETSEDKATDNSNNVEE